MKLNDEEEYKKMEIWWMELKRGEYEGIGGISGVMEKAQEAKAKALKLSAEPRVQVTAASAAGGAVTLGTTGGAMGFAAGGGRDRLGIKC